MSALYYLTTLHIPSTYANRAQVMKMSEAFTSHIRITLFVLKMREPVKNIFQSYGVENQFEITEIGESGLWPRSLFIARTYKKIIHNAPQDTIFYIREPMLAFMLCLTSPRFRSSFFFESHSFLRYPAFIYRIIFSYAKGIVVTTEIKKRDMQKKFSIPDYRMLVAQNAIDAKAFERPISKREACEHVGVPYDVRTVGFIGRPTIGKGIETILALAELLPSSIRLFAVGGSKEEIEALSGRSGFSRIQFIPHVPHSDTVWYMRAADVLLAPQSPRVADMSMYGSPLKALEYLASGTPALFADIQAMREMVPEELGVFIAPDDSKAWAIAIENIFNTYDAALKKAEEGRVYALRCTWDRRAKSILDFIKTRPI